MNWLITGGCGFIGTNLIARLIKNNEYIRVVDNLSAGTREDLKDVTNFVEVSLDKSFPLLKPDAPVQLLVADVRDADLAIKAAEGMDVIVHLAANTGVIPSIENPLLDCEINVLGILNYLEAARLQGVKRFIFASSGAPLGEQDPPINEKKVPRPISPYGASKLAGEGYCSAYNGAYGVGTVSLRFGNVYGPRSFHKNSVVAKFIKRAFEGKPLVIYGNGNQTRDFIYIDDLVEAILAAAKSETGGEVYQIATYQETTVNEIAELIKNLIQKLVGKDVTVIYKNRRSGEVMRNFSDITKARDYLGWEPRWDLCSGIEETVKWFIKLY